MRYQDAANFYKVGFFLLILYLLLPFNYLFENIIIKDVEKVLIGVPSILILLLLTLIKFATLKETVQLTILDKLLALYILFLLIHSILIQPIVTTTIFTFEMLLLIGIYLICRSISNRWTEYIIWLIVVSSILQILYGVSEQTKWFAPGFGLKDIIGGYINQGPFAISIACSILLVLGLVLNKYEQKQHVNRVLIFVCVLFSTIFILLLIKTNSRATWLAFVIALFSLFRKYGIRLWTKLINKSKTLKLIAITILILLSSYSSYMLYHYKKDSADGRLLIWRVTLDMISDKPGLGHGIDAFSSNYMEYQANYFQRNPNSPYRNLAGDNKYVFNELLKILCEQGIIGFALLMILIFFGIKECRYKQCGNERLFFHNLLFSCLILFIVFGLFSYPSSVKQLQIIFILILALISNLIKKSNNSYTFINKGVNHPSIINYSIRTLTVSVFFILLFLVLKSVKEFSKSYSDWDLALIQLQKGHYKKYAISCDNIYSNYKKDGIFLSLYGKALSKTNQYKKAEKVLKRAARFTPSASLYIDMGDNYNNLNDYRNAKRCWSTANYMIPYLLRPKYNLAKMYLKLGNYKEAKRIARKLLKKEIKITSIEVHLILEELKEIVKTEQNDNF